MPSPIPRLAAMHDLSGFGRASLTVVMPILSTMGVQVCPVPTALLSTHGLFPDVSIADQTEMLKAYLTHWRSLNIRFDAIYSGFLNSARQITIFSEFIREFKHEEQLIVIDPVLGDDGKIYRILDPALVQRMRSYIRLADVITPNLTEAALLLEKPYPEMPETEDIKTWLRQLAEQGPRIVIFTSVPLTDVPGKMAVVAYERDENRFFRRIYEQLPFSFPGTGDAFTSVLTGSLLQGDSLPIALDRAVQFLSIAIKTTASYPSYPVREGILLERVLPHLLSLYRPESIEFL